MENRKRIIELLTDVRYTTKDIEKIADEIYLLFGIIGRSEQLCDLDGKTVRVKFKVTKHIPKIIIEDI